MHEELHATHRRELTRVAHADSNHQDTLDSVWDHVIRALRSGPDKPLHARQRRAPEPRATRNIRNTRIGDAQPASCNAQIEVLERLSARTITILWQDATRCRYIDQVWTRCRARVIGRCAISGVAIGRDDIVFKPRSRGLFPGNARAMILASAIPGLPDDLEIEDGIAW